MRQIEPPEALGSLFDLWLLDNGKLFVPMRRDKKVIIVQYDPPNYQDAVFYPATAFNTAFNIISDDASVAGILGHGNVYFINAKRKPSRFAIPALKLVGLNCNGKYLAGTADKLYVWETMTGRLVLTINVVPSVMEFLRDGTAVTYTTGDKLVVWDIEGNRERVSFPLESGRNVTLIRSSVDGRFLLTSETRDNSDNSSMRYVATLYSLSGTEPLQLFEGHQRPIAALTFSRDVQRLVTSSEDGLVKVWDLSELTKPAEPAK